MDRRRYRDRGLDGREKLMKNKISKLGLLLSLILFLSACVPLEGDENSNSQEETTSEEGDTGSETEGQSISSLANNYYRPVVREGSYQTSESRGITLELNSPANIKAFEKGLMDLSKQYFSTSDHFFEEGQYIPEDVVRSWLGRESEDNPDGLNPEDNGETEAGTRNPIYVETILEQDYYVETDEGLRLAGISIGLGMNSIDYFQKEAYGTVYEDPIPSEEVSAVGQEMAQVILERLREVEDLQDVPVVFGIFEQSPRDSLAGGTYIAETVSESGASLNSWQALNYSKEVMMGSDETSNEATSFSNFKAEVENFFPNLSGVTGVVHYNEGQPTFMVIDITTQFYGEGEMIAFVQHVQTKGEELLPSNLPIEIQISSMDGVEAFLYSEAGDSSMRGHLFY